VVREALVVAAEQRDVDAGLEPRRRLDVRLGDHRGGLGDQVLGDAPGLAQDRPHLERNRGIGKAHPGELGDVLGEVAHALEVAHDAHGWTSRARRSTRSRRWRSRT